MYNRLVLFQYLQNINCIFLIIFKEFKKILIALDYIAFQSFYM
jgi:hypothetical protein